MGELRNSYIVLAGKPERERTLGRPRRKREDNVKMNVREIGWKVVGWMHLAQDRAQNGPLWTR
jgi:hypothetical protein